MLCVSYKNLDVVSEDHTDLIKEKQDVDKILRSMDAVLVHIKEKYEKGVYKAPAIEFVRLNGLDKLVVYVSPERINNPYLFIYNSKSKSVSSQVTVNSLRMLQEDLVMGDFESKIKHMELNKPNILTTEEINRTVELLASVFDKYNQKISKIKTNMASRDPGVITARKFLEKKADGYYRAAEGVKAFDKDLAIMNSHAYAIINNILSNDALCTVQEYAEALSSSDNELVKSLADKLTLSQSHEQGITHDE